MGNAAAKRIGQGVRVWKPFDHELEIVVAAKTDTAAISRRPSEWVRPLKGDGAQLISSRRTHDERLVHDVLATPPDFHDLVASANQTFVIEVETAWWHSIPFERLGNLFFRQLLHVLDACARTLVIVIVTVQEAHVLAETTLESQGILMKIFSLGNSPRHTLAQMLELPRGIEYPRQIKLRNAVGVGFSLGC
jgi:hypothetical protein